MIELILACYELKEMYLNLYLLTFDASYLQKTAYFQNSIDILENMIDCNLINDNFLN